MAREGTRGSGWALAAALTTAALLPGTAVAQGAEAAEPATPVRTYLDSAMTVMRTRALGADTVDWQAFRSELYRRSMDATETTDTWPALRWALRALNPHSFLQLSDSLLALERGRVGDEPAVVDHANADTTPSRPRVLSPFSARRNPTGTLLRREDRRIAVVAVPAFGGAHREAFADSIQDLVRAGEEAGACGWVVDLRGNGGGNMWPMLAGLGALVGDGVLGEFHTADGVAGLWFVADGVAGIESPDGDERTEAGSVSGPPFHLDRHPPVAVLFDGGTGSSGEAVAIAFVGRRATRSFGVDSYGFTTANQGFRLPDGANMVLTTGVNADRTGTPYPSGLTPDVVVPLRPDGAVPAEPPEVDAQLDAAVAWLFGRPGCAAGGS